MSFYARLIVAALPAIPESEERGLQKKGKWHCASPAKANVQNSCNHIPQKPMFCQKRVLKNLLPLKIKYWSNYHLHPWIFQIATLCHGGKQYFIKVSKLLILK